MRLLLHEQARLFEMDKNRIPPEKARKHATKYPAAMKHLEAHGFYTPDILKDNGKTRTQKAVSVLALMQMLKAVSGCDALIHGELKLATLDRAPLYSKATISRAQAVVETYMRERGITAFIWKLERGRNGGTHAEIVIPADSDVLGLTSYKLIESDQDEEEVAKYLCKPADARACGRRPKDKRVWTDEELDEQRMAAIETWARRTRKGSERLTFLRSKGLRKG